MSKDKLNRVIYRLWHSKSAKGRVGYIGKDKFHPARFNLVRRRKFEKNTRLLYRALNKYPLHLWHKEILESGFLTDSSLDKAEQFWIAKFKANGEGYNLTDGGGGSTGRIVLPSTKQKLRDFNTWKPDYPDEVLKLYSENKSQLFIGRLFGVSVYAIRTFLLNNNVTLRPRYGGVRGRPKSPEHRKKIGAAQMGPLNHMWVENPSKTNLREREYRARKRKERARENNTRRGWIAAELATDRRASGTT